MSDRRAPSDPADPAQPEVVFLTDGGQPVDLVADRLVAFVRAARHTLDLAIYDAHFEGTDAHGRDVNDRVIGAINDAERRGVEVRAVYNDDDGPGPIPRILPRTGPPSFLHRLTRAIAAKGIDGRFDLMHHKYVVRDAADPSNAAVWTGSTNWSTDSFTRMENLVLTIPGTDLAAAYTEDFEQLWDRERVEGSGRLDDEPARLTYGGEPFTVRALFSPGRGRKMSQTVAKHIGEARERIRICSPVITSTPILGTLAETLDDHRVDSKVAVDGTQMREVLHQWREDGRGGWKIPLFEQLLRSGRVAGKRSTPYAPGSLHDFMHAKLVVCDDVVLTGSYNCSHSGEMNAENLLEIRNRPFADRCAAFVETVYDRYYHA